jgi:hypothetical protein
VEQCVGCIYQLSAVCCIAIRTSISYGEFSETTQTLRRTQPNSPAWGDLVVVPKTLILRGKLVHTDNLVADCIQDNFADGMQMQLAHEITAMRFCGLDAATKDYGYFFCGLPLSDELKDFSLTIREGWQRCQT